METLKQLIGMGDESITNEFYLSNWEIMRASQDRLRYGIWANNLIDEHSSKKPDNNFYNYRNEDGTLNLTNYKNDLEKFIKQINLVGIEEITQETKDVFMTFDKKGMIWTFKFLNHAMKVIRAGNNTDNYLTQYPFPEEYESKVGWLENCPRKTPIR